MVRTQIDLSAAIWRRSSHSNSSGGNCVEVAEGFATWRKSSHSNGDGGNCLEVADGHQDLVPVRDSKRPEGPVLVVPASAWNPFVESVKTS
ncbi:DUF397 domain-containing protein [Streptomyces sp. NBC_01591]|uniref:DUF397 domain-containing protein n=1 Tax=Streptomyces sp. NBC_01591 TaxID=2975888 RepID=UPI002DDAD992|nr:DUF397 domain-containing protein [Streptomyces sp. NBC_01591]WSD68955.1 DUF397 domain-containing protein [Streptomyces sp. NBC_01591]